MRVHGSPCEERGRKTGIGATCSRSFISAGGGAGRGVCAASRWRPSSRFGSSRDPYFAGPPHLEGNATRSIVLPTWSRLIGRTLGPSGVHKLQADVWQVPCSPLLPPSPKTATRPTLPSFRIVLSLDRREYGRSYGSDCERVLSCRGWPIAPFLASRASDIGQAHAPGRERRSVRE